MKPIRDLRPVLRPFLAAQPGKLALGAWLATLTVLMGMGLLGLSGWFITATAAAGLSAATALTFDVFMPSAGIRLLALGRTASRYGERLITHDATFAVLATLRVSLFRGWAHPDASRALRARPSRLLFRLTADLDALESLYLRIIVPALAALGAAVLAGIVVGFMQPYLGLLLLWWLIMAGWGIALAIAYRARPAAVRRARSIEALRAHATDLVAGQTELVMAGRLNAQLALLAATDRQLAGADLALNRLESAAGMAYGLVGTLTLVGILLAAGALVGQSAIGVPSAALMLLVALTAMEPFAALRRGAIESGRTWLAARRLAPRLDVPVNDTARALAPAADAAVQLRDISAAHAGSLVEVLHGVTLHVARGERVALIGPSGAGKSTLMAVISGELAPRAGVVEVQAHCLLTQRTELFQDSLRDNLLLARADADDEQLRQALRGAGLADDVLALERGLATPLGEGGLGLSGGQSRRLALARLLLRDVPLWLLDEPTEALDADIAHDVLQRLAAHADGKTLLISTHLRREAELADRLLCVREGRIVADLHRGQPAFQSALATLRPD